MMNSIAALALVGSAQRIDPVVNQAVLSPAGLTAGVAPIGATGLNSKLALDAAGNPDILRNGVDILQGAQCAAGDAASCLASATPSAIALNGANSALLQGVPAATTGVATDATLLGGRVGGLPLIDTGARLSTAATSAVGAPTVAVGASPAYYADGRSACGTAGAVNGLPVVQNVNSAAGVVPGAGAADGNQCARVAAEQQAQASSLAHSAAANKNAIAASKLMKSAADQANIGLAAAAKSLDQINVAAHLAQNQEETAKADLLAKRNELTSAESNVRTAADTKRFQLNNALQLNNFLGNPAGDIASVGKLSSLTPGAVVGQPTAVAGQDVSAFGAGIDVR